MEGLITLFVILAIYFAPAMIASQKPHATGVTVVNLFLGWTVLGWFAAFVWAFTGEKRNELNYKLKRCGRCAEYIKKEATVCRYCQASF